MDPTVCVGGDSEDPPWRADRLAERRELAVHDRLEDSPEDDPSVVGGVA